MRVQAIVAQIKREFWENKVGFIWGPLLCSFLVCLMMFGILKSDGEKYVTILTLSPTVISQYENSVANEQGSININIGSGNPESNKLHAEYWDKSKPDFLAKFIMQLQLNIHIFLGILFFIVALSYANECLFKDRESREILFWRSMPVSETVNVLIKVLMICIVTPVIIFLLCIFWSLVALLIGMVVLGDGTYFMPALIKVLFSFQYLGGVLLLLLALLPVIGWVLFASALVKKSPVRMWLVIPTLLYLLANFLASYGYAIGWKIIAGLDLYLAMIKSMAFSYMDIEAASVNTLLGYVAAILVGAGFIVVSIWLRNNRYEI